MSAYDDLYAPIPMYRYHFRCNHGDEEISFSSSNEKALCPQCALPGRLIGYDRRDGNTVVYTPVVDTNFVDY
jgi:hypothetical protein